MLIIRQQQMDAFRAVLKKAFLTRLADRAEARHEEARALGRAGVEARVEAACARAGRYGLTSKRDVARFVDLDFTAGEDFENAPGMEWARQLLETRGLNGATRLFRVESRLERMRNRAAAEEEQNAGRT